MKSFLGFSIYALALASPAFGRPSEDCKDVFAGKVFDCPAPGDHLTFDQVKVSSTSPKAGEQLTISVSGTVNKAVQNGAKVVCEIFAGDNKLFDKVFDVCQVLASRGKSCPVTEKSVDLTTKYDIPSWVPQGSYKLVCTGSNADGNRLGKFIIHADIQN